MIARWIKEYQKDDAGQAFRGNGKLTPEQLEMRRLKEENKRLKMEKDVLKKAAVFFACQSALKIDPLSASKIDPHS